MSENNYAQEFEEAYKAKFNHFYKLEQKQKELVELQQEYGIARQAISHLMKMNSVYPMIFGNSFYRISITNIGTFPPYKYTSDLIYPMNYTSKKNYKVHSTYQKTKKDKILYICSVKKEGFEILAEDGKKWSGENFWQEFSQSIENMEYKSFEEFSGLNYPAVIRFIEKIGDIRELNGYVLIDNRNNKENVSDQKIIGK